MPSLTENVRSSPLLAALLAFAIVGLLLFAALPLFQSPPNWVSALWTLAAELIGAAVVLGLFTRLAALGGASLNMVLFLTASWQSAKHLAVPMFFAGSAATTLAQGDTDRGWFVGFRQPRGFLHYDLELLHHNTDGDAPVSGNALLLKTSYGRHPRFVPALLGPQEPVPGR